MKRLLRRWLPVLLCTVFAVRSEEIKLPVTADTSISCFPSEHEVSMGDSPRIKMKGIENFLMLNFDSTPLIGKQITKAILHIKGTDKNMMVRKVGFSTVATAWTEGKSGEGKAVAACFKSPELSSGRLWAGPGSSFLDAVFSRGGTIWTQSYVSVDADLWYTMEFDGRLLEACAAGLSHGICVSDDNGQTMSGHKDVVKDGNFSNNYFFAHEQSNAKPYFTVEAALMPPQEGIALAVSVKPWQAGADFEHGAVEISWPGPKDSTEEKNILGCAIETAIGGDNFKPVPRWMLPPAARAGETVRALLTGLPANSDIKAKVRIVWRGGAAFAGGEASGKTSAAYPAVAKIEPRQIAIQAQPPAAGARAWVMPDCVKANPITGNVLEESGVDYEGDAKGTFSAANAAWDAASKSVKLNALQGEWAAFQIVCQNADKTPATWTFKPSELAGPGGAIPDSAFKISRLWYQKTGKSTRGWYADPMLPIAPAGVTVPDSTNAVPDQTNQTVYVEFFVPKNAAPGSYSGNFLVNSSAGISDTLKINLSVANAAIPDAAHFTWSMNAYNSPGDPYGKPGSEPFNSAERGFYAISHEHRTNLAVLHYGHGGTYLDGCAPPVTGTGKNMKVSDWSKWDERFGPLFDASAFKGTPREGVPMDHFYLCLCEHYPTPMTAYKWNNVTWEEHWKVAGPIEEGFDEQYRDQWTAVAKDYLKHIQDKGWKTQFQIYLNDKYFYKQYTAQQKKHGRGVCFWLLDEPQHIDDFTALAFFSRLNRDAIPPSARDSLLFRVDVSRPQWGRDTLDRGVDLNVSGGFAEFRPWLEDWRERYGQRVWTYGGAPASTSSALAIEAQAIDLYSRGVDGFVPWLTLGHEGNWKNFEDTCVFYTGKPMGVNGACASLRLKAYRRAEQDVEYVWLLANKLGYLTNDPNRKQVAALLSQSLKVKRMTGHLDAQGAVTESLSGLHPEDLEAFRLAIVERLK